VPKPQPVETCVAAWQQCEGFRGSKNTGASDISGLPEKSPEAGGNKNPPRQWHPPIVRGNQPPDRRALPWAGYGPPDCLPVDSQALRRVLDSRLREGHRGTSGRVLPAVPRRLLAARPSEDRHAVSSGRTPKIPRHAQISVAGATGTTFTVLSFALGYFVPDSRRQVS
jgi:hypothetical protein